MSIPPQTRAFRARLPVPTLRHTLERYLDSLEPFLHEDERRGGMPFSSAYALREKWAAEFESGIGGTLQERLLGSFVHLNHFMVLTTAQHTTSPGQSITR